MLRVCDHCRKVLVDLPRTAQQAEQHCASPNCHWCMTCQRQVLARVKGA